MNTKVLNSREFYRSPAKVARLTRAGTRIIVTQRGEEIFEVVPRKTKRGASIEDFRDLIFHDPKLDRNLSKKVDEIVYGSL
jgi:antitoxin (DNA-binding transcriptional repressor) of toxin-antitoxin stability system